MQKVKKSFVYCIFFPLWVCLGSAIFYNRFNEEIVNVIWNNISTCCNFKITFNTGKEGIQNFHCIKYQFEGFPPFYLKSVSCLIILSDKNGLMICQNSLVICNVFSWKLLQFNFRFSNKKHTVNILLSKPFLPFKSLFLSIVLFISSLERVK